MQLFTCTFFLNPWQKGDQFFQLPDDKKNFPYCKKFHIMKTKLGWTRHDIFIHTVNSPIEAPGA